ncbi:MAG: L-2-hydroxyglutarate oxidase [Balneolaceae bacterium]
MSYDFTVIGAGIVGLSAAYKLTLAYPEARILVLEKEGHMAAHQSGRNSGVIHSGIYYRPGSYRARNCVEGRRQLIDFCQEHGVKYDLCGKIIVAVAERELPELERIYRRGLENGIGGIRLIGAEEIRQIEPFSAGVKALHVPGAGIVDYKGVCRVLSELIRDAGGDILFNSPVERIRQNNGSVGVHSGKLSFETGFLINCTGLQSDLVAKSAGVQSSVQIVPFRGEYFRLIPEVESWINGLIYPLPNPDFPFLGVHFTRMATGGVECGPNAVFSFKREGYGKLSFDLNDTIDTVNFPGFWRLARGHWKMGLNEYYRSFSKKAFLKELRKLIPGIKLEHLKKSPAGVRAMALKSSGEILDDFHFERKDREIHVLNAPSPAATASLAIGDEILRQMNL